MARRKFKRKSIKDWVKIMHDTNAQYGTNFQSLEDVKQFQRAFNLVDDGKIGPNTREKILSIINNQQSDVNYDYNDPDLFVPTSYFDLSDNSILALNDTKIPVANGINGDVNPANYPSTTFWADRNGDLAKQSQLRKWRDAQIQLLQQQTNPEQESWVNYMGGRVNDFINGIKQDYSKWQQTAGQYDQSNPFRQGSDAVANTIYAIALSACMGAGLSGLYTTLVEGGLAALPEVLATLGTSYIGQQAWESATVNITGESWDDLQKRAGIWEYNRALNQPGAYVGGYIGNTAYRNIVNNAPAIFQNALSWLEGNIPRVRIANQPTGVKKAPSNGDPAVMKTELMEPELLGIHEEYINPGEVIVQKAPTSSSNYGKTSRVGYKGNYTTHKGARGSASGQPSRVQVGGSGGYGSGQSGVQGRVMQNGVQGKANTPQDFIEYNPYPEFAPLSVESGILGVPIVPPAQTEEPPDQPPIIIGPPPEEPQTGFEKVTKLERDPWEIEFEKQKKIQGEGGLFYWPGHENSAHLPMWYRIKMGGRDVPTYRRDVANHGGYRAIDSTKMTLGNPNNWNIGMRQLGYDVPDDATLGEQIIYKVGGKLVKKPKYL